MKLHVLVAIEAKGFVELFDRPLFDSVTEAYYCPMPYSRTMLTVESEGAILRLRSTARRYGMRLTMS